jgi:hypothetical protein
MARDPVTSKMAASSPSMMQILSSTIASRSAAGTRQAVPDALGRPRLMRDWLT